MAWVSAGKAIAVEDGEAVVLERAPEPPIAVFNVGGEFYAIDDTCTHEEYSLADGYIDGNIVECPLHMARFDICTGKALSLPATAHLGCYAVKVEDGLVYVEL